jgi:serine/threonine protein kinase
MQLFAAIEVMNSEDITHNDIKPENIMTRETENGQIEAYFIDFGFASSPTYSERTEMGTPGYMTQNRKDKGEYNSLDDLFSLVISMAETYISYESKELDFDKVKNEAVDIFESAGYGSKSTEPTTLQEMSLTEIFIHIIQQKFIYSFKEIMNALKAHATNAELTTKLNALISPS